MFKHILVPTDGSHLSREAITKAISFAKETGARITFFSAKQVSPALNYGIDAILDPNTLSHYHEIVEGMTNDILDDAQHLAREAGVESSKLILTGDQPYQAIIEAAKKSGCDLIFMASHGRRGVSALLLGSETHKVLTHSTIPVLVYR